jgi:hypothetical protein
MAMSARLSVTVITSVLTRLNAATATISVRMMNIIRFSTCTAANQVRFWRVQSAQQVQQRALAGPRGPDHRDDLAGLHGQVDALQHGHIEAVAAALVVAAAQAPGD